MLLIHRQPQKYRAEKIRKYIRKATNWSIGFVLTGYVFHGLSWRDYRDVGLQTILTSLITLGFVFLGIVYVTLTIPTDIQFLILGILTITFGILAFIFITHWLGVKYIEMNQ